MKIIHIEPGKCTACKNCEIACAVQHSKSKVLSRAVAERPLPAYRIDVSLEEGTNFPLQCRHCEDAPCVSVCPSKAMHKEPDNIVIIDQDKCIGCKFCIVVCPFGAIKADREDNAVVKCDLCRDRVAEGKEPACVEACLTGALKFLDDKQINREKKKKFLSEISL